MQGADRAIERELDERIIARRNTLAIKKRDVRRDARSTDMEVGGLQMAQRVSLAGRQLNPCVEAVGRGMKLLVEDPIAAADTILVDPGSGEIERAALPRMANLCRCVLGVEGAHAHSEAGWREEELVADPDRACEHRPGGDRADARQCKTAIDREPKPPTSPPRPHFTSTHHNPPSAPV